MPENELAPRLQAEPEPQPHSHWQPVEPQPEPIVQDDATVPPARRRFAAEITQPQAIADHYADFAGSEYDATIESYGYEAHHRIPAQVLARHQAPSRARLRVLDLGCGTGLVARPFFDEPGSSHVITGVDVTPQMTASAQSLPYARVLTAMAQDALANELAGELFDVVLVCGMMEFVKDPVAFLQQVVRALARGGLLGLAVPHKQTYALERRFGILTHALEPLDEALRSCGLEKEWSEDFNGYTLERGKVEVMYRGSVWSKPLAE
jgi:2-polyprenyl-3-methyl-5-hydroxy-6-metoxy-1,4-benzoquinol methylase|eukprot:COSAG02_NODE_83_length_39665_cov_25.213719_2_plen_265_part_00